MSLLEIVYQSLILFVSLFTFILSISYISYRIKRKTNPVSLGQNELDLQPAFAGETESFIKKNPYFNQPEKRSVSQTKSKKRSRKFASRPNLPRYTKIDFLIEEEIDEAETKNYGRHSSISSYSGKRTALHYDNVQRNRRYSLKEQNILNYYDDTNTEGFYPFKTKF